MLMMESEAGFYIPSFLYIKINTHEMLDALKEDSPCEADIVHEYIHFLQDISTVHGLANTARTLDYLKAIAHVIANQKDEIINVPIRPERFMAHVAENDLLFEEYYGDIDFLPLVEWRLDYIRITQTTVKDKYPLNKYELCIRNVVNDNERTYSFGSLFIMESMAALFESHIYSTSKKNSLDTMPYGIASAVFNYLHPGLSINSAVLAAICELSLMSYQPGETFYQLVTKMKEAKFIPKNVQDVYSFTESSKILHDGNKNMFDVLDYISSIAKTQIKGVITIDNIKDGAQWYCDMVDKVVKFRRAQPCFIAQTLELHPVAAKYIVTLMTNILGMPLMFNADDLVFSSQKAAKQYPSSIYFPVVNEIYTLLRDGNRRRCRLVNACSHSNMDEAIDNNCSEAPWLKAHGDELCPFAMLWKGWGFLEKRIEPVAFK